MTRQAIEINSQMQGGSWAVARHIRRGAPWLARGRIRGAISTFFEAERTGVGVDVYMVDSGLRFSHAEFGGRGIAVGGVYGEGAVDDHGHGTEMASMVAGATVGFARGASLRIVKGLDSNNAGTSALIAAAIDLAREDYLSRAATNRPAVLNLSLFASLPVVGEAAAACIDAGMVVVTSAGNNRSSTMAYPGLEPDVVVVGGLRANDTPYYIARSGSNWGPRVDILAGAELVWAAEFSGDNSYQQATGTSGAAALVSGAIACMLHGRPRLRTRMQVRALRAELVRTATTGKLIPQPHLGIGDLPDRILYFDPKKEAA